MSIASRCENSWIPCISIASAALSSLAQLSFAKKKFVAMFIISNKLLQQRQRQPAHRWLIFPCFCCYCRYYIRKSRRGSTRWIVFLEGKITSFTAYLLSLDTVQQTSSRSSEQWDCSHWTSRTISCHVNVPVIGKRVFTTRVQLMWCERGRNSF